MKQRLCHRCNIPSFSLSSKVFFEINFDNGIIMLFFPQQLSTYGQDTIFPNYCLLQNLPEANFIYIFPMAMFIFFSNSMRFPIYFQEYFIELTFVRKVLIHKSIALISIVGRIIQCLRNLIFKLKDQKCAGFSASFDILIFSLCRTCSIYRILFTSVFLSLKMHLFIFI